MANTGSVETANGEPNAGQNAVRLVRDAQEGLGYSQNEIADRSGWSHTQLSEVLNLKGKAAPERVKVLEQVLQLPAGSLDALVGTGRGRTRHRAVDRFVDSAPQDVEWHYDAETLSVEFTYIFREGRTPSHLIERRRVRALENDVRRFGLKYAHSGEEYELTVEGVYGGAISNGFPRPGTMEQRFWLTFGEPLQEGDEHEFIVIVGVKGTPPEPVLASMPESPSRNFVAQVQFAPDALPVLVKPYWTLASKFPHTYAEDPPQYGKALDVRPDGTARHEWAAELEPGRAYGLRWWWDEPADELP